MSVQLPEGEAETAAQQRVVERRAALAAVAVAIAALVGGLVIIGPWRVPDRMSASPTASPIWDVTQLSEAQQWGRLWSVANGTAVLRPMWLPPERNGYSSGFSIAGGSSGLSGYRFWYYANGQGAPGTVVRSIELIVARDELPLGLVSLESQPQTVTLNGHAAQLLGAEAVPVWEVSWSELGYRYGLQIFGYTRDDLLHIATSLAGVLDERGTTRP